MKKTVILLLVTALLLSVASGCSNTAQPESTTANATLSTVGNNPDPTQNDEPMVAESKYGGILSYTPGVQSEQNLGYPAGNTNMLMDLNASPALESLFRLNADDELIEWLVERHDVSSDGLTYVFTIKSGIQFHDGSPLNAEAVAWNIQQCMDAGKTQFTRIASVTATDEYTVTVQMSEPDILFLYNIAADPCGLIISPTSFEANGAEWAEKNPVGTGPFVFVSWENDVKLVYERNENYWGVDEDGNQLPYLDGIEVIYMTEPAIIEAALESKEVQAWVRASTDSLVRFNAMGDFAAEKAAMPTVNQQLAACTETDNPAAIKEVRQAVDCAIDFDAIVNGLFNLNSVPTNQCSLPGRIFYNENINSRGYDPEKAKELLAAAGFADGVTITLHADNSSISVQTVTAMVPYLEAVGITVNLDLLDTGGYFSMLAQDFSDGFLLSGYNYAPHEFGKMYSLMSKSAGLPLANFSLTDETYELYEKARSSVTIEECIPLVRQIQEDVYGEDARIISCMTQYESVIRHNSVRDTGYYGYSGYHWTPEAAYLAS